MGWLLKVPGSGFVLRPVVANKQGLDSGPSYLPVALYKGRHQLRLGGPFSRAKL